MCCVNPLTLALDQLLAFCLVGPLVVAYWRSGFNLFDIYMLPNHSATSTFVSIGVGNIGMLLLPLFRWIFRQIVTKELGACSIRRLLGYSLFMYIAGFISLNQFRGGWHLLLRHAGTSLASNCVTIGIAFVLLASLRCFKNCTFIPFHVAMDLDPEVLEDKTRFSVPISSPIRYALDSFLSTVIVRNLVVSFWKGGWGVLDHLLYPKDPAASGIVSVTVVALVLVIMYPVQVLLLQLQAPLRKSLLARIVLDDIVFAVTGACTVLYWRGIWLLLDVYVLTGQPVLSNWVTWAVSEVGLGVLGASATALTIMLPLDGDTLEEEGATAVFPNKFIRFYRERQTGSCAAGAEPEGEEVSLLPGR